MSEYLIDGMALLGASLVVGGVYLLAGVPWALITAGSLLLALSLIAAKVHNATDSE